jgi:hypothetical protein
VEGPIPASRNGRFSMGWPVAYLAATVLFFTTQSSLITTLLGWAFCVFKREKPSDTQIQSRN